jgi:hypothetical protein
LFRHICSLLSEEYKPGRHWPNQKEMNMTLHQTHSLKVIVPFAAITTVLLSTPPAAQAASIERALVRRVQPVALSTLRRIKATPEQRRELLRLGQQALVRLRGRQPELMELANRAQAAFSADSVDGIEVNALGLEVLELLRSEAGWLTSWLIEVASTLTPEQRGQLLALVRRAAL